MGEAPYPVQTPFGIQYQNMKTEIDEDLLRQISDLTDGQYFRATNKQTLTKIYEQIDQLEKKIEVKYSKNKRHTLCLQLSTWIDFDRVSLKKHYFKTIP